MNFFIHCDTWNYVEKIQKSVRAKNEILLAGSVLEIAETANLYRNRWNNIKWQAQEGLHSGSA